MSDRCHLYLPLIDSAGNQYPYAQVTLLNPDTLEPIVAPVYADPSGGSPLAFPVFSSPGLIDLWCDVPMRVTVVAVMSFDVTVTLTGVDFRPPPTGTVRTLTPVRLNAPVDIDSTAVLVAGLDGTAAWQVSNVFNHHNHEGDAPASVVLGPTDPTNWATGEVWIGPTAGTTTDPGSNEIGIGSLAVPHGAGSIAIGPSATAQGQGTAIGSTAQAGSQSTAMGAATASTAASQALIGRAVTSATPNAVAIGSGLAAYKLGLGPRIRDDASGNTLIGTGTVPDTTGWAGPFIHLLNDTVAPQALRSPGDTVLAAGGALLGAYGGAGGPRAPIDGTAATGAALSLLQALDALGLIFLITGSTYSDNMVDFSQMTTHDANLVFDTTSGTNFEGRTSRLKRNSDIPSPFSYTRPADAKTFLIAMYARTTNTTPGNSISATAATSSTGTPMNIPVACTPQVTTAGGWYRVNVYPTRDLPPGMRYLTFTLKNDPDVFAPQIGKIWFK